MTDVTFRVELVYKTGNGRTMSEAKIASCTLAAPDEETALVKAQQKLTRDLFRSRLIGHHQELHILSGSTMAEPDGGLITEPVEETPRPAALDGLLGYVADNLSPVEALRALHATLNDADFAQLTFRGDVVRSLLARLDHYEQNKPSWANGTPEDYDAWLRDLTPDDRRLKFYQWIGAQAVAELVEESRKPQAKFDGETVHVSGASRDYANGWNDGLVSLPLSDDPHPSALPLGRPFCDVGHHIHRDGGGRLPTCRLDSPE